MDNFQFQTVPKICFGAGALANLSQYIQDLSPCEAASAQISRPVIVTDKGVVAAGLLDQLLGELAKGGFADIPIYDAVLADPPEHIVLEIVAAAKAYGADCIIGFGGGSPMDSAKLVALLARDGAQPLDEIYGIDLVKGPRLPLILIPTTAGTGSEVTSISVITTGETSKSAVVAPQLYADIALLDPELTLGLPPHITAATGIDAMVHAIEAYSSKIYKNPMSDMLAIEALKLLSANLVRASTHGEDLAAREAMLRGAMLAGQAFANAPVGAVHALAYPLGGIYHIPHGLSNALVLPHVLRFNQVKAAPLYSEIADALAIPSKEGSSARSGDLIDFLVGLSRDSGAPQRLRDADIPEEALDRLADEAMLLTRLLVNNPREMSREQAYQIYRQAW